MKNEPFCKIWRTAQEAAAFLRKSSHFCKRTMQDDGDKLAKMKVIHQKDLYKNQKYQPSVHVGLKNLQINGALLAKCGLFRYPVK